MVTYSKENRLIYEKSPYLRQHAYNPIDWYPWGDEAFDLANTEDKPIFLSIGYSTCHWCHVMARESFENAEVARILNKRYVAIKVDREQRPDIDMVYMNVCQAMTGSGGWPLTLILTPDKKPLFAATYLPPKSMYGRIGLIELLEKIAQLWEHAREELIKTGENTAGNLTFAGESNEAVRFDDVLETGYLELEKMFDKKFGGFSYAPKFPMPHYLMFLLRDYKLNDRANSLKMVKKSLAGMYKGGVFDHVGGGFSRYSTDQKWLVPHFEKMLYDNALLLQAYAQGYAVTGELMFRYVAKKTAQYLIRNMQTQEGGFYSAEDADSEGREGLFYVWEHEELKKALSGDELSLIESDYGVGGKPNFEDKYILNRLNTDGFTDSGHERVLDKLFAIRENRVKPFKDTKISAAWNGFAIDAMAQAGMLLDAREYVACAKKAADFIISELTDKEGTLLCGAYLDGAAGPAFLADYANMVNALISVYLAQMDTHYLEQALMLAKKMLVLFEDENGFFMSENQELFIRPRDEYDGALPSGSSCAVMALVALWRITGEQYWQQKADKAIDALLPQAAKHSAAHIHLLSALMMRVAKNRHIIISSHNNNEEALSAYKLLCGRFEPFDTVLFNDLDSSDKLIPYLKNYRKDVDFAAYMCENFSCRQPVYTAKELFEIIKQS